MIEPYKISHMTQVRIKAPAKINLGLEIIGKREDGYHMIETLFQAIDLYDELSLSPADCGVHLNTDRADLVLGEENLIFKAASLLLEYAACPKGVKIHLKKRIPIGAGLGGGSSDAAATLKGLIKLYALPVSKKDIQEIAVSLGADVPFFLNGPIAFGHGIGESLEPSLSLPPFWVLIVKPDFSISTAWAYHEYNSRLTKSGNKIKILQLAVNSTDPQRIGAALFNDLESVCLASFPILVEIKNSLLSFGACGALLSGSGSAVFGLFSDHSQAYEALRAINKSHRPGEEVFLCRTILK